MYTCAPRRWMTFTALLPLMVAGELTAGNGVAMP